MRPSHQSQHSRQRPAPSGRPMDCPACARRAGSLRDAGASTFVICVCPWPLENKVEQGINVTSAPEPGRHVQTADNGNPRGGARGRPSHGAAFPGRDFGHVLLSGSGSRGGERGLARRPTSIGLPWVARSTVSEMWTTEQGLFPGGLFPNFRRRGRSAVVCWCRTAGRYKGCCTN